MNQSSIFEAVSSLSVSSPFSLESRIHSLRGFGGPLSIKRDDELSFGISGSKYRKFVSLVSHWKNSKIGNVEAVGGAQSNHILASLQICNELGLPLKLHLLRSHHLNNNGNYGFLKLLANSPISWIERDSWQIFLNEYQSKIDRAADNSTYLMAEGGFNKEAISGSMSLGLELWQSHCQGSGWKNIFLDCGTGFSAGCTAIFLGAMGWKGHLHIVSMSQDLDFSQVLKRLQAWTKELGLGEWLPCNYSVHPPATARSFGAYNKKVGDEVKKMAVENGVLVDPVYSAKLTLTVRAILAATKYEDCLMVHSGGALNLSGFWDKLHTS